MPGNLSSLNSGGDVTCRNRTPAGCVRLRNSAVVWWLRLCLLVVFDYISYKDFTGKDMIRVSRLCYVLALCNDVVKFFPVRHLVFRKLHEECEAELQSRLGKHIGSVSQCNLQAHSQSCNKRLLISFVMSVRLSAWKTRLPPDGFS